ncbi:MAG TPA: hypothetical protein VL485_07705 [Ktedonobacteraceae bacterium]|nr:hypothetical protein [Ktedonobacteraceae bacterium]
MQEQLMTAVRLAPEYSPLVELATRLGYSVYIYPAGERGRMARYRVDNRLGRYNESDNLMDALAFMIKREMLAVTTPTI